MPGRAIKRTGDKKRSWGLNFSTWQCSEDCAHILHSGLSRVHPELVSSRRQDRIVKCKAQLRCISLPLMFSYLGFGVFLTSLRRRSTALPSQVLVKDRERLLIICLSYFGGYAAAIADADASCKVQEKFLHLLAARLSVGFFFLI